MKRLGQAEKEMNNQIGRGSVRPPVEHRPARGQRMVQKRFPRPPADHR